MTSQNPAARNVIAEDLADARFMRRDGRDDWLNAAGDVISALDAAGLVIVPREMTEAMAREYAKYWHDNWREGLALIDTPAKIVWGDMIAAAEEGE